MSNMELKINFEITKEPTLHNAMLELAQNIYDEHGVRIENIRFEWYNFHDTQHRSRVTDCKIMTSTRR